MDDIQLPEMELPKPQKLMGADVYDSGQMRAHRETYARAAVLADREQSGKRYEDRVAVADKLAEALRGVMANIAITGDYAKFEAARAALAEYDRQRGCE